jgi:hypothetical protein
LVVHSAVGARGALGVVGWRPTVSRSRFPGGRLLGDSGAQLVGARMCSGQLVWERHGQRGRVSRAAGAWRDFQAMRYKIWGCGVFAMRRLRQYRNDVGERGMDGLRGGIEGIKVTRTRLSGDAKQGWTARGKWWPELAESWHLHGARIACPTPSSTTHFWPANGRPCRGGAQGFFRCLPGTTTSCGKKG